MQPDLLRDSAALCRQAKDNFIANALPTAKTEDWIYTRLSDLAVNPADKVADEVASENAVLSFASGWLISGADGLPAGVSLTDMQDESLLAEFAAHLPDDHFLSDLSLGHATGAYVIDVAAGAHVETPLQLVFSGGQSGQSAHPLIYVRVGEGAACQIAEIHNAEASLSAPVMVMTLADSANVDHMKCQKDDLQSHHLALTIFAIAEKAQINSFTAAIGSALGRHETHAHLNGENCDVTLSSLYLGRGTQHQDMTTRMLHHMPNCTSNQVIRGVLDDTARGVFQGKVLVARDAQKTDGQQMSRALLLSRKAEADAKPELEIYADDVVCSHGATVGELDETHLFYLKSRGIAEAQARNMLIEAFLLDALEIVCHDQLSEILEHAVHDWMNETLS